MKGLSSKSFQKEVRILTQDKFTQAVHTYGGTVYRVAYHALKNRPDAEDVMQTVLLKLYQYPKEFESEAHMKHWLLRVTVNESRRLLGSFWRRNRVDPAQRREEPAFQDPDRAELFQAVMSLERKYRVSIYLYYYEGCSVKEVAAAMRANPSTVQTWLLRARQQLRQTLSNQEEREEIGYVQPQIVP